MATLLYRLGRFSFRRRGYLVAAWAAILVAFGIGALTLSGQLTNSFSIPGTESQRTIDELKERFPELPTDGGTARVVFAAPDGHTLAEPANQAAMQATLADVRQAPQVANVADPAMTGTIAPDGKIAMAQVTYKVPAFNLEPSERTALLETGQAGKDAGLQVEFGGEAAQTMPEVAATEGVGVAIAAVVLIITFGSLIAAGLPLLTALAGIGVGMAGITTASGFLDLNANTPVLALMIGLAVGIDYALFIVSRYRHELEEGADPEEAAGRATGTAGSAVVFAGLTVIIALAGLTVVGIPFLGEMGIAAALTVAIAVLIALTLLPATLGFAGRRVFSKKVLAREETPKTDGKPALAERWARFVSRRKVPVLITTVAALAVVAYPATDMQLGLPNDSTQPPASTQHQAYDLTSQGFGEGANGPLVVMVDTANAADRPAALADAAARINGLGDVAVPVAPPQPGVPGMSGQLNSAGDAAMLTVIPRSGPSTDATKDLVNQIREQSSGLQANTGATISVTGPTAMNIDISDKLADAMLPYLALIVGLAFLLLMLVFRSIVVPLKATVGFLGSVVATFGAVVAVFQWGWLKDVLGVEATGPIMSMLPILLIGVLFGLAMDYQVFLVTRMREEHVHGASANEAMVTGFRHGARVVVAAALIMVSVFAGFILAGDALIKSIGFALAFGVAVDAFLIRMTIVPALMSLLGKGAWWLPRWLDKVLPNVDVEGERMRTAQPKTEERVLETSGTH